MKIIIPIKIQSFIDVITNSSTELFVLKNPEKTRQDILDAIYNLGIFTKSDIEFIDRSMDYIKGDEKFDETCLDFYDIEKYVDIYEIVKGPVKEKYKDLYYKHYISNKIFEYYTDFDTWYDDELEEVRFNYYNVEEVMDSDEYIEFLKSEIIKKLAGTYILMLDNNTFHEIDGLYELQRIFGSSQSV